MFLLHNMPRHEMFREAPMPCFMVLGVMWRDSWAGVTMRGQAVRCGWHMTVAYDRGTKIMGERVTAGGLSWPLLARLALDGMGTWNECPSNLTRHAEGQGHHQGEMPGQQYSRCQVWPKRHHAMPMPRDASQRTMWTQATPSKDQWNNMGQNCKHGRQQ
jgi:hypothetical protein